MRCVLYFSFLFPEFSYFQNNINNLENVIQETGKNVFPNLLNRFVVNQHFPMGGLEWLNLLLEIDVSVPTLLADIGAPNQSFATNTIKPTNCLESHYISANHLKEYRFHFFKIHLNVSMCSCFDDVNKTKMFSSSIPYLMRIPTAVEKQLHYFDCRRIFHQLRFSLR